MYPSGCLLVFNVRQVNHANNEDETNTASSGFFGTIIGEEGPSMNGLLEELQRYMSISHRGIAGDRPRSLSRGPTGLRRPAMHERHKSSWKHPASVVRGGPTRE